MEHRCCDLERVQSEHAEFIHCVNEIYSVLNDLHYLHSDEIVHPPYNVPGKPSIATCELRHLGFTEEVLMLLELLPYPSNDLMNKVSVQHEGLPIAPDSGVVSYLAGADQKRLETARQPFCDGDVGIPAWAFKITTGGPDFGTSFIYDTRSKTMVRWDAQAQLGDYFDQPSTSPFEAQCILVGELSSLDWLPWRVEHGETKCMNIISRPTYKHHMSCLDASRHFDSVGDGQNSRDSVISPPKHENPCVRRKVEVAKAVQNSYMCKRNIYEECGWPRAFRADEFEKRRKVLDDELYDLIGTLGERGMCIHDHEEGRCLREWYRCKAGANAAS